jgi:soluble lytic murein transglycosylase-like protein
MRSSYHRLIKPTLLFVAGVILSGAGVPAARASEGWTRLRQAAVLVRAGDDATARAPLATLWRELAPPEGAPASKEVTDLRAGAAYLLARIATRAGEGEAARSWLARADGIKDVYAPALAWAEIELREAERREAEALAALRAFRKATPRFRRAAADLKMSRLLERAGEVSEAAAFSLARYREGRPVLPADELLARAARALTDAEPTRAAALWRQLALKHPESPFDEEARQHAPLTSLDQAARLIRVERLFAARAYEACRREARALWREDFRREDVGYYLGKIGSERLRDDYVEAERGLRAASRPGAPHAKAALQSLGIVLSKLERLDASLAAFDDWLRRYRRGATAAQIIELHYDRGRALRLGGKAREAARQLRRPLQRYKRGFDWVKYWWFVAFWSYLGGDAAQALADVERLCERRHPLEGGKARYWKGAWLQELGRGPEALATWSALMEDQPLTYYAALAEARLFAAGAGDRLTPLPDFSAVPDAPADPFAGLPGSPALRRLKLAVHLAEPDTARRVWRRVKRSLRAHLGAQRLAALERALAEPLERHAGALAQARQTDGAVVSARPSMKTLARWRALHPRGYRAHVEAAAAREGIPAAMIYGHIWQESRFDPSMISGAPAFGLMELLDRTARRLVEGTGEDYQIWRLLRPAHNIRWGGRYLGALLKKFHGQIPFAVASYNGGPMLLERHMGLAKGRPFDEMIDDIGPHQCRNYVRMVLTHFLRYLALYEPPEEAARLRARLLPATWEARWRKEPDY